MFCFSIEVFFYGAVLHYQMAHTLYCLFSVQMGYGARALQALNSFYSGEYFNLDEATKAQESYPDPSIVEEVRLIPSPWHHHLAIH